MVVAKSYSNVITISISILAAMKSKRLEKLGMFLLLFSILFMCYLVFGRASRINARTNWNCKETLNAYQFKEVNDNTLNELVRTCRQEGMNLNDNRLNIAYLKHNLRTFSCQQSWKYLSFPKPLVALASYPGSGNTWTRELIETVTGIHTGSIYTDWNFIGSQLCPSRGKVFIIKTHRVDNETSHKDCRKMDESRLNYTKAVFILRNPYSTLLAEFNRQNAMRPPDKAFFNAGEGLAPVNLFGSEKWKTFVKMQANKWKNMTLHWLNKFNRPVFVLIYERVRKRTVLEMYNLTKFLNMSVHFRSLYCLSSNTTGNYHRVKPKWMTTEKLYDNNLRRIVNTVIENVNAKVGLRRDITNVLHSYLLPID